MPSEDGSEVKIVRTGKVGKRWQHEYSVSTEEARMLYARLRKMGYEKF